MFAFTAFSLDTFEFANPTFLTLGLRFWNFWASLKEHRLKPQKIEKKYFYRYLAVTGEFLKKTEFPYSVTLN